MNTKLINNKHNTEQASKDLQTVSTQVSVKYSLNSSFTPQVYKKIGLESAIAQTLIEPAILESLKAVTVKYAAEELVTQRAKVKVEIQESITNFINNTLKAKDLLGAFNAVNVAITDFDFSQEFNRAIELKVKAEQEALQAKNEKARRSTQAEAARQR